MRQDTDGLIHMADLFGNKLAEVQRNKDGRKTERGEFLRYFSTKINQSRVGTSYRKITMARMGTILEGVPTRDLYHLRKMCDGAHNFSAMFFWMLDPKNAKDSVPT